MTITRDATTWARRAALVLLLLSACRQGGSSTAGSDDAASSHTRALVPACASDSLHPVVSAPAGGLWVGERNGGAMRVAAMVGPSGTDGDRARITRRVETLELRDGVPALRLGSDTASVSLQLLPPFGGRAASAQSDASWHVEPAAVYAITPLALLASYEPCDASAGEPRIRYLRRDEQGFVAIDLMLRRESSETAGALP